MNFDVPTAQAIFAVVVFLSGFLVFLLDDSSGNAETSPANLSMWSVGQMLYGGSLALLFFTVHWTLFTVVTAPLIVIGSWAKTYALIGSGKPWHKTLVHVALAITLVGAIGFHFFEMPAQRTWVVIFSIAASNLLTAYTLLRNKLNFGSVARYSLSSLHLMFAISTAGYFLFAHSGNHAIQIGSFISIAPTIAAIILQTCIAILLLLLKVDVLRENLMRKTVAIEHLESAKAALEDALVEKNDAITLLARVQSTKKVELYTANLIHEINQPLSVLSLEKDAIQKVTREPSSEIDKPALDNVISAISKLEQTVTGIRKLQRHTDIDLIEVNLVEAISEAVTLVAQLTSVPHNAFAIDCHDKEQMITTDESLLNHIIFNLLLNAAEAIKFKNTEGVISIRVSSRLEMTSLCIEDNGSGFSADETLGENVYFMPFATTKKAGTGIGLQVVQTAIKLLDGKIEFGESSLGGAKVTVSLPDKPSRLNLS